MNFKHLKRLFIALVFVVSGLGPSGVSPDAPRRLSVGEGGTKGTVFSPTCLTVIPQLDLSDLDARDAQNRPISTASEQAALKALFVDNLSLWATEPLIHQTDEIFELLQSFSRLFRDAFYASVGELLKPDLDAAAWGKKRVVHIVDKLWITFFVGNLSPPGLPCHFFVSRPLLHLILRC